MKNTPTTKAASGGGKGAKGKAKEAQGSNGSAAAAEPFVFLPPPRADALSVADPLNEQGEVICTAETSAASVCTTRMPRPPPPPAALMITG